ncbi:MAG: hypothetical protein JSV98_08220 [candidate division WOR-3 bacterium]|nr:MAG: hypothetical protein JSV98_08220 [candidate division WOR-3 bacterium]
MRDFTLGAFELLLDKLIEQEREFVTFEQYCRNDIPARYIIMRHDVDKHPESALRVAEIENRRNIRASYYFRTEGFERSVSVIRDIVSLGHEIGYHYEDLSVARGSLQYAIVLFKRNLEMLRELYPVKTICMHGSPLSRYDNRTIWEHYDYRQFGVVGEPYLDIDFNEVIYLTDTGRRWNGTDYNVRDKVASPFVHNFRSTFDIVHGFGNGKLPQKAMITVHPHRWNEKVIPWLKELIWQNAKNVGKRYFLMRGR